MTRRVLISISDVLLDRIDEERRSLGMTRSGFIAQLADERLLAARGPGADPAVHASLAEIDALFDAP